MLLKAAYMVSSRFLMPRVLFLFLASQFPSLTNILRGNIFEGTIERERDPPMVSREKSMSFCTQPLTSRRSTVNQTQFSFKFQTSTKLSSSISATVKRNPKRLKYSTPRFTKDDGFVYVEVDPFGSDTWKLQPVIKLLQQGAVGVIPTDTVYAFVCDVRSHAAIERLRRIKDIGASKPLSILCRSFRDIDTYTLGFPWGTGQGHTNIFRVVKHCLPGPYTFILPARKELPKQCSRYGTTTAKYASRKEVGVRMPNDAICQAVLEKLDAPLISTSVKLPKGNEWIIDPVVIADIYEPEGVDFVVGGGIRIAHPSTVVDTTKDPPTILRQGKGPKQDWMTMKEEEEDSTPNLGSRARNFQEHWTKLHQHSRALGHQRCSGTSKVSTS